MREAEDKNIQRMWMYACVCWAGRSASNARCKGIFLESSVDELRRMLFRNFEKQLKAGCTRIATAITNRMHTCYHPNPKIHLRVLVTNVVVCMARLR